MMKKVIFSFFAAMFALIAAFGLLSLPNKQKKGEFITIEINKGQGIYEIGEKLEKAGLVRFGEAFTLYSLFFGDGRYLKPGHYVFYYGDSFFAIEKILLKGPKDIEATILPGATIKEIDGLLSDLGIIEKGDVLALNVKDFVATYSFLKEANSLEGFLLPDTYFLLPNSDPKEVINRFLDNFKEEALPFLTKSSNILKITTIASILEKEIPDHEEQKIGAGVLEKRLSIGMPLQVDASIIYAKCNGRYAGCATLLRKDFLIDSPYNTYLNKGLPPTPISNASVATLKAAANPTKTDYIFYLSDPESKKTIWSKTLDEHNQNRVIYLNK